MRSFSTILFISALFSLEITLAAPSMPHHPGNRVPSNQGVPQAQAAMAATIPLPRLLSRDVIAGSLPIGHRPSDLGADVAMRTPRRQAKSQTFVHRQDVQLEERHDHINSPNATTVDSCSVGEAQCCQSIHQSSDKSTGIISSILGLALPADGMSLGMQCSPLANLLAITGSSTCNHKPVCCTGNEYDGLVSVGCSPISA